MAIHAPITGAPTRASAFDRRAILGALGAISIGAAVPALVTTPAAAWEAALTRYNDAKSRHDKLWTDYKGLTPVQEAAATPAMNRATEALEAAEDAIWNLKAPHAAALAWKVEHILAVDPDGYTSSWSAAYIAPLLADARRLAGAR